MGQGHEQLLQARAAELGLAHVHAFGFQRHQHGARALAGRQAQAPGIGPLLHLAPALQALGADVKVFSQANLVAESLADYLTRRPEFIGPGKASKFLTTGDPASVSSKATQFLRRKIAFEAA